MRQTILTDNGIRDVTEIERLEMLRSQYYNELLSEIATLNRLRREKIQSFRDTCRSIDRAIHSLRTRENKNRISGEVKNG